MLVVAPVFVAGCNDPARNDAPPAPSAVVSVAAAPATPAPAAAPADPPPDPAAAAGAAAEGAKGDVTKSLHANLPGASPSTRGRSGAHATARLAPSAAAVAAVAPGPPPPAPVAAAPAAASPPAEPGKPKLDTDDPFVGITTTRRAKQPMKDEDPFAAPAPAKRMGDDNPFDK